MKGILKFVILIIVIQNSCLEKFDYQKIDNKPVPVVNCMFTNDSIFKVWIGITSDTLLTNKPQIEITKAFIKDNFGNIINLHKISKNLYVSDSVAHKGVVYELIVETKNYGLITAKSSIPNDTVKIISNNFKYYPNQMNFNAHINIKYNDIPNKNNYYQISLINRRFNFMTNDFLLMSCSFSSRSPIIAKENINFNFFNIYCYSDKGYENQLINIDLFATVYYEPRAEVVVVIKNTSPEYYLYYKSLSKYLENNPVGFDFENFIKLNIDPSLIQIYSNINGGFGVFAGYNITKQSILIPFEEN